MDYNAAIKEMMEGYGQETPDCPIEFDNLGYEFMDSVYDAVLALDRVVESLPEGNPRSLRISMLVEEFQEYLAAEKDDDRVEVADALGDIKVILQGTGLAYGFDMDAIDSEIHASNMSKMVDGKVVKRADGKVMKPEGYFPPNLSDILGCDR